MKKNYRHWGKQMFLALGLTAVMSLSFAQQPYHGQEVFPDKQEYLQQFHTMKQGTATAVNLQVASSQSYETEITIHEQSADHLKIIGQVKDRPGSRFYLYGDGKDFSGHLVLRDTKEAYHIYTNDLGEVITKPVDIDKVLCVDFNSYTKGKDPHEGEAPSAQAPMLESLPGAAAVIYLDFDGENVSGGRWGTINAQPSGFSDAKIEDIWQAVAEDYIPFKINVTTDRSKWSAAAVNRRMMVIFTPTNDAAPGAGGVAYLQSFRDNTDDPCWVFNNDTKGAIEAASHEAGHTMGLSHDGTSSQGYYAGHGNWGPIMGACYNVDIVQWSKGEYSGANNTENDLSIISGSSNGFGYRTDDHGNTIGAATPLVDDGNGNVAAADNNGIIEKTTDVDLFSFTTSGGAFSFNFKSHSYANTTDPDLDIQARILDSGGNEVMISNPSGLTASFSSTLSSGTYYIEIDGVGYGNPSNTGYSDYGSLGYYEISGSYTAGPNTQPPVASFVNSAGNCSGEISFTDQSQNTITTYLWDFGDGGTSSQQNPTYTYTTSGTFTVKLTVTGPYGTNTSTKNNLLTINLPEITSTTGDASCGPAALTLQAAGKGTLEWYDAQTGGNMVGSGTSFTTPLLNNTTSYWVQSRVVDFADNAGPSDNTIGTGASFTVNDLRGLFFDVLAPFTLKTVKVYAGAAGDRTIEVLDGDGGNVVHTKTVTIPSGESRVTLDFPMTVANGYFIKVTGATVDLYRNDAGPNYPYTVTDVVSITGSNASSAGYYYYFYDWEVENSCTGGLEEVVGTINSNPATPVVTYTSPTLSTPGGLTSYQWYHDGNIIVGATNNTYDPTAPGNYTVEVTDANGCKSVSDPFLITSTGGFLTSGAVIMVFPNPGTGVFQVQAIGEGKLNVRVVNALGQVVFARDFERMSDLKQVDLTGKPDGVYRLQLQSETMNHGYFLIKQ
ncbi:MAG: PKD domain-containing protein [Flavobacteriales bacterium]|nr:PKD domain-containing protein [Flavobacteriales bacterium]